jgi:natural product precursor
MKKIKLKLNGKEMLSKDQMKKISGGYGTCDYADVRCNNSGTMRIVYGEQGIDCSDREAMDLLCEYYLGSGWVVEMCTCY